MRRFATDGGTERYAVELTRWLVGRGHEVHVYCGQASVEIPGVHVHTVLPRRGRGAVGVARDLLAARRVQRHRHDVVQAFIRVPGCTVYRAGGGAHLAWLHARGSGWRHRARTALSPADHAEVWADRNALCTARIVVCNSRMAANDVCALYGISEDRVRVVRNGVDPVRFRPSPERRSAARRAWGVQEGGRVALFLANGYRRKGLSVAAQAFARVSGARDRLVVMGRDAHARRILAPLGRLLGDRLVVQGPVPRPERWLPGADATLLPTRYDSAANTTLEALASGVPPVTSGRDGNAEVVPEPALVVTEPADVAGFAAALCHAWSTPGLGARCRRATEAWPVSRNGEGLETLYRELVDG
ncbi:MAG: glycosyltransferase family 4 protein [Deltaproteobacteria bacterium]|nr:glycosyltransferase family 4 protein [Deltaproteobacteria bacterium]